MLPSTTPQRACAECGKLFIPHSANQAYHNDLCRQRAYRQRSKNRRKDTKELPFSDYFKTYFAQTFQDVSPSLAQSIWLAVREDPKRHYAVFNWTDFDNTTIPFDIEVSIEQKDGICYHNVYKNMTAELLKWTEDNKAEIEEKEAYTKLQKPLSSVVESNPAEFAKKYA